ncbi:hypothetical protein [uncultured Robinsoniella sp.]|uniref:hypothetical protein n=1 Tax=uncultured Robinsoniella sp. TaxID=904190 RepID=UPI00374FC2E0
MIKEILDYHRLERVADVGRMQILSYILLCFLLGQTFLFGNGVLSLTLWVFVFTIQKLRRVYFEEHSIMRYAPLPRRDIIQNLLIKSYFYLLLTLMIDMSVTYDYMIYMYSQSSMPRLISAILFYYFCFIFAWYIALMILTLDSKIVRFTLFTGEVIILIIAVINLYPTLHEKTGDLILLIAQSPYFYLYLIVAGILAIGTSVAGIQLFSSKIYQA